MHIDPVKKYLASSVKQPFFMFIGDGQYATALDELSFLELDSLKVSGFCSGNDKLPDIDKLISDIEAAAPKGRKIVVTGLGEYLALRGKDEATHILGYLKFLDIGCGKVVFVLRGLASLIAALQADPRFDNRRFSVVEKAGCDLSITLAAASVGLSALSGFKSMLEELEGGRCGNVVVNTSVNLEKAIITIHKISSPHEGIKFLTRGFSLAPSCGNDEYWAKLLTDLNQNNSSLDEVFEKYGFGSNLEADFYTRIAGNDYRNWLYFICLKLKTDTLMNGYLRLALDKTSRFEDFLGNVLNAIIDIPHVDGRFPKFYQERKVLVEKFPESDIASFVTNNRQVVSESIFKLTDTTRVEREEIIAWLSKNGVIPQIGNIYPALADYLGKYFFKCSELDDLLTDYFEAYKRQKLSNRLEPEFLNKVDELAQSRLFNRLPTRNAIMEGVDKNGAFLCWLDALGVEYLSLIEALAQRRGLSLRVSIARAELPTITSINRGFFDAWEGPKEKNGELDDVKHGDTGGYDFTHNELPVHLAKELDIITAMIEKAATQLALKRYKRFLIVSDHGASRLAVLRRKEEKYDTDTTGEHSGRCCKLFEPHDLPFAAEENGYLVLADYGRFKGSRAANVEVHGGASFEEVVVPVIELALKDGSVTVKLMNEVVTADFRAGTEIELFTNPPQHDVSVVLQGKRYAASQTDAQHYAVKLPDVRRAGEYSGDVYAGDNLIGTITIKAQGKSGKINNDFDDLF